MRPQTLIVGAMLGCLVAGIASAEPTYRWVFDQSVYEVNPGGAVDVRIYLEEAIQGNDTGILDSSAGNGLGSIGLAIYFPDRLAVYTPESPQPSEPAKVRNDSDVMANPAFDFSDMPAAFGDHAELNELILLNPPIYGVQGPVNTFRVVAGTFTFTAGNVPWEKTPIRATDLDPNMDDTLDSLGNVVLDSLIADGTATIYVVPEPGSITLLAAAVLSSLAFFRRRLGVSKA